MTAIERLQTDLIRQMTPCRRLEIAMELYETAQALKADWLRRSHPLWEEEKVRTTVRRIFLTGHAGA